MMQRKTRKGWEKETGGKIGEGKKDENESPN